MKNYIISLLIAVSVVLSIIIVHCESPIKKDTLDDYCETLACLPASYADLMPHHLELSSVDNFSYNYLFPFKFHEWPEIVTGTSFFSYSSLFSNPVFFTTDNGTQFYILSSGKPTIYNWELMWVITCLLSVLVIYFCSRTKSVFPGYKSVLFIGSYSLLICLCKALSFWLFPFEVEISMLCIAFFFSFPFIFCLDISKIGLPLQLGLSFVFFDLYFLLAQDFDYLYFDLRWLILCTIPAGIVFLPSRKWTVYLIVYLGILYAYACGLSTALDYCPNRIGEPLFIWSIFLSVAIKLSNRLFVVHKTPSANK